MWMAVQKPEIGEEHYEKRKETTPSGSQKNIEYRNISYLDTRCLDLACQGGSTHPFRP